MNNDIADRHTEPSEDADSLAVGKSNLHPVMAQALAPFAPPPRNELAATLARAIMSIADRDGDKAQRIEFKGGLAPQAETSLGGLDLQGLERFLERVLEGECT